MFNAKRKYFRLQDWGKQSGGDSEASSRLFMDKLFVYDRITTPFLAAAFFPRDSIWFIYYR